MQNEMDNNDNLVIQGLEALLGGEDSAVNVSHSKSFEEMRTKFKESFSLDQSKDSGIAFSNLSFRHLPSVNTSIQNQSVESGYSCDLFDTPFSFKQSVRNVSFDGCFIEDDFSPIAGDVGAKYQGRWNATSQTGILSSAVSHGGDIRSKVAPSPQSIQEGYAMVKYTHTMRKCWNTICCINKIRTQLTQKPTAPDQPAEWNLMCLLDAFKKETAEVNQEFKDNKLIAVLQEIQNSLELVYTNVGGQTMDLRMLKQLERLASNLFVALYCQCVLQNSLSTPSEDKFRSEKRYQIWNSLA